jgi:hypothetical protein
MQVAEESMHFLAAYYNMSVFHYKTPRIPNGRDYMLEINPHYKIRDQSDGLNVIDARWIDTETGLFIDITTVRKNYTHPAGPSILSCKDGHEFRVRSYNLAGEDMIRLIIHRKPISTLSEIPSLRDKLRRFLTLMQRFWKQNIARGL